MVAHNPRRRTLQPLWTGLVLLGLAATAACTVNTPSLDSIRDSKLLDRRIHETPRQKTLRECHQEAERFRVGCTFCHATDQEAQISAPAKLGLTDKGRRAQVMRGSPTFGLYQQCGTCHQSKFTLTSYAEKMFGPQGARHRELEAELNRPVK